ncbi:hypothetical protein COT77_03685 [Candidatus Berkelbacteria bacterium CG10_big_fil_rev_8_21_14_0_10_41_12]|uniref:Uncharacterized protein n=1 Tax=Candidatus Berkelbacteria bacterium CG10_big_fil_rev_8_21_14_0_10_41_12 TaxID=1974513 RepID=A0A2M6WWH4_9BACT|nr:MAG: hypothetical protein COT77_03685 [Candidatus Berkelbacteria bacterium CG10_big_fil_rev_8_21_14_0_10_41_12]
MLRTQKYELIAVVTLAVAVIGTFALLGSSSVIIRAQRNQAAEITYNLKEGWNRLRNDSGYVIDKKSKIVRWEDVSMSLEEAIRQNLLTQVSFEKDSSSNDIPKIMPGETFWIYANGIDSMPKIMM